MQLNLSVLQNPVQLLTLLECGDCRFPGFWDIGNECFGRVVKVASCLPFAIGKNRAAVGKRAVGGVEESSFGIGKYSPSKIPN